jgi:hypothetical protein
MHWQGLLRVWGKCWLFMKDGKVYITLILSNGVWNGDGVVKKMLANSGFV